MTASFSRAAVHVSGTAGWCDDSTRPREDQIIVEPGRRPGALPRGDDQLGGRHPAHVAGGVHAGHAAAAVLVGLHPAEIRRGRHELGDELRQAPLRLHEAAGGRDDPAVGELDAGERPVIAAQMHDRCVVDDDAAPAEHRGLRGLDDAAAVREHDLLIGPLRRPLGRVDELGVLPITTSDCSRRSQPSQCTQLKIDEP
jgi:hypothetical protein